jgi:basic amino acid/polyamine antiporter, APA family
MYGLGWTNWLRLGIWLLIGLVLYFGYGMRHSRLNAEIAAVPAVSGGKD